MFINGYRYCLDHCCAYTGCKYPAGKNANKLCSTHYNTQVYCEYVDDKGKRCQTVIGRQNMNGCEVTYENKLFRDAVGTECECMKCDGCVPNILACDKKETSVLQQETKPLVCIADTHDLFLRGECSVSEMMESDTKMYPLSHTMQDQLSGLALTPIDTSNCVPISEMVASDVAKQCTLKYCGKHKCSVSGCYEHICDDTSQWCHSHGEQCEYMMNGGTVRCRKYVLKKQETPDDLSQYTPHECVFCDRHRCHWNGSGLNLERECHSSIVEREDCVDYCYDHYRIFKFYKYEYA